MLEKRFLTFAVLPIHWLDAKKNKAPLHITADISVAGLYLKNLYIFYQFAKDVKSVFTFQKWPLVPELKLNKK